MAAEVVRSEGPEGDEVDQKWATAREGFRAQRKKSIETVHMSRDEFQKINQPQIMSVR